MEKALDYVGPDALVRAGERSSPGFYTQLGSSSGASLRWADEGIRPYAVCGDYAVFFSSRAEFFDPNPTQLQIACSISALRSRSGT